MTELPNMPAYEAVWRPDRSCSYCGSMNPDDFMARVEAGTVELGTTDKNYKVYVRAVNGTPETPIKFYFQHLSVEQQKRFIELTNEKRLKFQGGFGFGNRPPFFMTREPA